MATGGSLGAAPGVATLLLGALTALLQLRSDASRRALSTTAAQLPGWAATLMFALSPLPQLVRHR